jgi:hypothetical protein
VIAIALSSHARSWCRGMVQYFCVADDDEHDFSFPIGFEDDAKMMNLAQIYLINHLSAWVLI